MSLDVISQMEKKQSNEVVGEIKQEVIASQVKETINVQYKSPDDNEHKEIKREVNFIEHKFFEEHPLYLTVDYSHTIPMRPYESAKISVGLSIPIGKEIPESMKGKIDSVYQYASKYLEGKIAEEVKGIQKYLTENKK